MEELVVAGLALVGVYQVCLTAKDPIGREIEEQQSGAATVSPMTISGTAGAVLAVAFGTAALFGYSSANASDTSETAGVTREPAGTGELPSKRFDIPTGVTADGRTYGSLSDAAFGKPAPDLISVIGDAGRQGFADRRAMESLGDPSDPSDMAEFSSKVEKGELKVPVYEKDGTTQLDTFTVGALRDGFSRVPGSQISK